jgi:hypothetical protein
MDGVSSIEIFSSCKEVVPFEIHDVKKLVPVALDYTPIMKKLNSPLVVDDRSTPRNLPQIPFLIPPNLLFI